MHKGVRPIMLPQSITLPNISRALEGIVWVSSNVLYTPYPCYACGGQYQALAYWPGARVRSLHCCPIYVHPASKRCAYPACLRVARRYRRGREVQIGEFVALHCDLCGASLREGLVFLEDPDFWGVRYVYIRCPEHAVRRLIWGTARLADGEIHFTKEGVL